MILTVLALAVVDCRELRISRPSLGAQHLLRRSPGPLLAMCSGVIMTVYND